MQTYNSDICSPESYTEKMHKGYAVYLTNGGYEYIIRHAKKADDFEFLVIEQLHDNAIKLVRQHCGKVYKVTEYTRANPYRRAVADMEKLYEQNQSEEHFQ